MRGKKGTQPPHGTTSRYRRGCRCPACRAAHAKYSREWRRKDWRRLKRMNLYKYGLTVDAWLAMVEACGNRCEACGQEELGENQYGRMALAVDHNHETGRVRGLLCHRCNRALGLLGDDPVRLDSLAVYRRRKG